MGASELETKRLRELALRARHGIGACYTRFLEPSMEQNARAAAREAEVELALWGGYPEGVSYSILLMNLVAPLIDRWVKPRVLGSEVKKHA